MKASPHLPLEPLLARSGVASAVSFAELGHAWDLGAAEGTQEVPSPMTTLSELTGFSTRALHRWARSGVPLRSAEDACDALGLHPAEVWGDGWIEAVEAIEGDAA